MEKSILIIDDIPKNIQVVAQHLKPLGYKLLFATSADDGIKLIHSANVVLVLLDIMMPEKDGYEAAREIRTFKTREELPILFLTALNNVKDVVKGFDSGGSDYIMKPFHTQELLSRVKTHLALSESRALIKQKEKEQQDLLYILSHDLTNSLSGISMSLEYLEFKEGKLSEMDQKIAGLAQNGLHLLDFVKTLLVNDKTKVNLSPVNLSQALEKSLTILQTKIEEKNIKINHSIPQDVFVMAEKTSLINSVLNNLLTNSIKFSYPHGAIQIYWEAESPHKGCLHLVDHGIGMSQEQLQDLFKIKKIKSTLGTKGEVGTGFGLPLVQKFMLSYKGKIEVESHKGVHSTLYFHLP